MAGHLIAGGFAVLHADPGRLSSGPEGRTVGYFDTETTILPLPSDPRNEGAQPSNDGSRPPGYWVEIKDELDFGDTNYRNKRIVRLSSKGLAGAISDANAEWEIDQFSQATLERAIVGWNLNDQRPTPATIQSLKQRDAAYILKEIMERNVVPGTEDGIEGKAAASAPTMKRSTSALARFPKQRASAT